jgi:5-formyltetrahydrofolate cyclo-ligase
LIESYQTPVILNSDKADLRKSIQNTLGDIRPERIQSLSSRMAQLLAEHPIWKNSFGVLTFAPLAKEPDLSGLMQEGRLLEKTIALLRTSSLPAGYEPCLVSDWGNDLRTGAFGILEPNEKCELAQWNQLDLALIPGVAFDQFGRRLGKGKGFYDRVLVPFKGLKIGVCFDEQMVKPSLIPMEPHDIHMDWILTPSMLMEVNA